MQTQDITTSIDTKILAVLGSNNVGGFQKAHAMALAIEELKGLLTNDYMKPIMQLQGNRLGFRTDKDNKGGYDMGVVRNCLIEAVLMGLQPCGNQFNIIAGNTYITKEGCGYLINLYKKRMGLKCDIICGLPKVNPDKTSAAVDATIKWTLPGHAVEQGKVHANIEIIPIPIKIDQYASVDSIIGKATRKARAWLLSTITGVEVIDGDIEDTKPIVVSSNVMKSTAEKESDRIRKLIETCETMDELHMLQTQNPDIDIKLFNEQAIIIRARG